MNQNETRWVNDYSHFMEEYVEATDAEHHGIPRQRWGIKHGPPYPLDRETHDRIVSGKGTTSIGAKYKREADRAKKLYKNSGVIDENWKTGSNMLINDIDRIHEDIMEFVSLNDNDPDHYYGEHYWSNVAEQLGKDYASGRLRTPFSRLTESARGRYEDEYDFSDDDSFVRGFDDIDLKGVNPGFGQSGTTQNCTKCSAAIELIGRGINICAGHQIYPASSKAMEYWFNGAKSESVDTGSAVSKLLSFGESSSGTISGYYPNNAGGHCMHFDVHNGKIRIQDGQNATEYDSFESCWERYGFDSSRNVNITRLDNCEPNWEAMADDSVLSGGLNGFGGITTYDRLAARNEKTDDRYARW